MNPTTRAVIPIAASLSGPRHVLLGYRLLLRPGVRGVMLIPLLGNIALYTLGAVLALYGTEYAIDRWLPTTLDWLRWLIYPLLIVVLLALSFFSFTLLGNLLLAPFNGRFLERVERALTGKTGLETPPDLDIGCVAPCVRNCIDWATSLAHAGRVRAGFVPVIGVIAIPLGLLLGAWLLALEFAATAGHLWLELCPPARIAARQSSGLPRLRVHRDGSEPDSVPQLRPDARRRCGHDRVLPPPRSSTRCGRGPCRRVNSTPAAFYRGRFAPSPTGALHFGSLLTAFASWLRARQCDGTWVVRIEDLDPPREVAGAAELQLRTLDAYGMTSDEHGLAAEPAQRYLPQLDRSSCPMRSAVRLWLQPFRAGPPGRRASTLPCAVAKPRTDRIARTSAGHRGGIHRSCAGTLRAAARRRCRRLRGAAC